LPDISIALTSTAFSQTHVETRHSAINRAADCILRAGIILHQWNPESAPNPFAFSVPSSKEGHSCAFAQAATPPHDSRRCATKPCTAVPQAAPSERPVTSSRPADHVLYPPALRPLGSADRPICWAAVDTAGHVGPPAVTPLLVRCLRRAREFGPPENPADIRLRSTWRLCPRRKTCRQQTRRK
jgi:hypothetical protein